MARPAKATPRHDGSGGLTTAVVSLRVPAPEVPQWQSVFQMARDLGLTQAQQRLATDPGAWGALRAQATATWERLRSLWPEGRGDPPPSPDALMNALLDAADTLLALEQDIRAKRQRLKHLEVAIADRERAALGEATDRLRQLEEQIAAEQTRWNLTREGTHMVAALAEAGWSTEELVAWGRALQASRADPGELIALWDRLGGLEAQIAVLEPAVVRLQQARTVLEQQIAALQHTLATDTERLTHLRKEQAAVQAEAARWAERVAALQAEAAQWQRTAEALGLWLPPLGEAWPRQAGDPARAVVLVLAAGLLADVVRQWGDADLDLPARFEPNHPWRMATTVGLAELALALAPPAVRDAVAGRLAPAPAPAPVPAETPPPTPPEPVPAPEAAG
jgi:predicted  nucleic acid-binding Zn-ribbon protein